MLNFLREIHDQGNGKTLQDFTTLYYRKRPYQMRRSYVVISDPVGWGGPAIMETTSPPVTYESSECMDDVFRETDF